MGINKSRITHTWGDYYSPDSHNLSALVTGRGATKVVAASDALNGHNADFQCDGTDDYEEFDLAKAEIKAGGGSGLILLTDGHFKMGSKATIDGEVNQEGIGLVGMGPGITIIEPGGITSGPMIEISGIHASPTRYQTKAPIGNFSIMGAADRSDTCDGLYLYQLQHIAILPITVMYLDGYGVQVVACREFIGTIPINIRYCGSQKVADGTATGPGAGNNTLADTSQAWDTNELIGYLLTIRSETGHGQSAPITSNTATEITVNFPVATGNWATNPDATSKYVVDKPSLWIESINALDGCNNLQFSGSATASYARTIVAHGRNAGGSTLPIRQVHLADILVHGRILDSGPEDADLIYMENPRMCAMSASTKIARVHASWEAIRVDGVKTRAEFNTFSPRIAATNAAGGINIVSGQWNTLCPAIREAGVGITFVADADNNTIATGTQFDSDVATKVSDSGSGNRDNYHWEQALPPTELTIASGVVTATQRYHLIDTESNDATDDLDTINGGQDGKVLRLRSVNAARDTTLKDGTGNLKLAGDFTLATIGSVIKLIYDATQSSWLEESRSAN